jgi:hypothetical protein
MKKMLFVCCLAVLMGQLWADYYPLAVGHRWEYGPGMTEEIIGTEVINGKTYYLRRVITETEQITKERVENGIVYQHAGLGEIEMYKLNANVGEEWPVMLIGTAEMVSRSAQVTVPAGTYTNCLHIKMSLVGSIIELWFADNVGIVKQKFTSEGVVVEVGLTRFSPGDVSISQKSWGQIKEMFK